MGSVTESVSTFNSFLRTILATLVLGGLGFGGYQGYVHLIKPQLDAKRAMDEQLEEVKRELEAKGEALADARAEVNAKQMVIDQQEETITAQATEITELNVENERLETARRLLKVDRRLARVKVLNVGTNVEDNSSFSDVEFQEIGPAGEVLGEPRRFRLNGDEIRVDSWIVKFDDKYIEEADLLRGTSLCVFKSIYGNLDGPQAAHALEEENSRPQAYGSGGRVSEFEQKIWTDFWEISANPDRAFELGIRASHGQVNYVKARPGITYEIDLRASDGMTIRPLRSEGEESTEGGAEN
ncbi:MAG: hypothetical protein KDA83_10090 [Planctomycetales bacterium]|nr:hypothetical protein [Planctomycetales bacterium]